MLGSEISEREVAFSIPTLAFAQPVVTTIRTRVSLIHRGCNRMRLLRLLAASGRRNCLQARIARGTR